MNQDAITWTNSTRGFVEASDCGFEPGVFPPTHGFACPDGQVRVFERRGIKRREGEIEEVTYRNDPAKLGICVLND